MTDKRISKVARTGLINLGDTSYLNSVLQCLGNIEILRDYFLKENNVRQINEKAEKFPFSFVIGRLYAHLYPKEEKERENYNTINIFKILGLVNQSYKDYKKRNPTELIVNILNILHDELNLKNDDIKNPNSDLLGKDFGLNEKISNYNNGNNSIISNVFDYYRLKENKCCKCKRSNYEIQFFKTLDLNILECYKKEKKSIKLIDCLNFLSIPQKTKKHCPNCKSLKEMELITKIYKSPNIFVFLLDRKDEDEELIQIPFTLEEKIDLKDYISDSNSPKNYELIGVVSLCLRNKKYVSFSKSSVDKEWYFYNDEIILKINSDFTLKSHNIFNFFVPNILFYKSIN